MSLLERFRNFTTGTPKRTLVSSILITLLIPLTLLANAQRWELRKDAAEPSSFTATDQLLQTAEAYNLATPLDKGRALDDLISTAAQRKTLLLQEIAENPKTFLDHILPSDARAQLPKELHERGLIERDIQAEGKLDILHFDDFENKRGWVVYKIGDYNLHFTKNPPDIPSGSTVVARGIALNSEIAVDSTEEANVQIISIAAKRTTGDFSMAVLMLNFPENRGQPYTDEQVEETVFTAADSVNAFYQENSYGQTSFSGDVFGWFELETSGATCDLTAWKDEVRRMAAEQGIDLDSYDRLAFLSVRLYSCSSGAAGIDEIWVNGLDLGTDSDTLIFIHELGHTFGLSHANLLECGDLAVDEYENCRVHEYLDRYDAMGGGYYSAPYVKKSPHFNGAHKAKLGWIPQWRMEDVLSSGTYRLYALEKATDGAQVLRIPKSNSLQFYYLEYRSPTGFDSSLPETITDGTLIHIWDPTRGSINNLPGTFLVDSTPATKFSETGALDESLQDGGKFNDLINGTEVIQVNHNTDYATISISLPEIVSNCPENTNPEPSLGKAVYFNEHTYIRIPSPNTLRGEMDGGFTVEAWIKPEFKSEYEGVAQLTYRKFPDVSGTLYSLLLGTPPSEDPANLRFSFGEISGEGGSVQSDYVIALNEWTHIAGVRGSSELKLFINGQLVATRPFINIDDSVDGVNYIGGRRHPYQLEPIYTFKGVVDDLRISNVARDVAANWEGGVYESPLIVDEDTLALWRFEENMLDSTPNNNNGTAHGNICFTQGSVGPSPSVDFGKASKFNPEQIIGVAPAYVEVDPSEELLMGENFTIEAWVKPDRELINPSGNDPQNPRFILAKEGIPDEAWGYSLDVASRKVEFGVNLKKDDDTRVREILFGQTELEQDRWYFIQAIKNGGELSLYLDGQLEATKAVEGGAVEREVTLLTVGCAKMKNFPSCLSNFYGEVDEIRISSIARSVMDVPTRPFSADEHTIALWHFDQNTLDATNNDLDGHVFGNVSYINSTVGADGRCIPESLLPGDLDCDCQVTVIDIMKVAAIWNTKEGEESYKELYDFDNDGRIGISDIMYVAARWATACLE